MFMKNLIDKVANVPLLGWIIQRLRERSTKTGLIALVGILVGLGVLPPGALDGFTTVIETGQETVEIIERTGDSLAVDIGDAINDGEELIETGKRRIVNVWNALGFLISVISLVFGISSKDALDGEEYEEGQG